MQTPKQKQWYLANRQKVLDRQKQTYNNDPQKVLLRNKKWNDKNKRRVKEYQRKWFWLKRYKLTYEQVEQMYISQGGCCPICKNKFDGKLDMHVDHNHTTEKVRQLLCQNCNRGIGCFKENVDSLKAAVEYLNKWNTNELLQ